MTTSAGEPVRHPLFSISLFVVIVGLAACSRSASYVVMVGPTMGTTYRVSVLREALPAGTGAGDLEGGIAAALEYVDAKMSTYRGDSEVSRFNASASTEWFAVSFETATVVNLALLYSERSDGAFDVTVGPLVDLWGFGPPGRRSGGPPAGEEIEAVKARCGFAGLEARLEPPALRKRSPELRIDLSAIAKGFAVDVVANYLEERGVTSYLVDIGGELRAGARKPSGAAWRVGIERPDAAGRSVHEGLTVALVDEAIATSGDYRNFQVGEDGRRYSHTIDPRTGRPVTHALASVSVLEEQCAAADALATALLVLGPTAGYDKAEELGVAALFIIRDGDDFREAATTAWKECP